MKKFFSTMLLFVAAALVVGCEADDNDGNDDTSGTTDTTMEVSGTAYTGTMSVANDGATTFTQEDTIFYLDESADKSTATLYATSVKFSTYMPVSLTIVALDVEAGSYYSYYAESTESLSLSGLPQGNDLEKLGITVDGDDLTVTFDYNYSDTVYTVTFTTKEDTTGGTTGDTTGDTTIELSGDKYVGSLTFYGSTQTDITFYVDADDNYATLFIDGFTYYTGGASNSIVIEDIPVGTTADYSSASGLNATNLEYSVQGSITDLEMDIDGSTLSAEFNLTTPASMTFSFSIEATIAQE